MRSLTACPSSAVRFSPANAIHEAQIAVDASSSVDMARARKPSGRRSAGQIGIVGRPACFPPQPRIDRGGRPRFSSCAARIDRPRIPGRYLAPIPVLRAARNLGLWHTDLANLDHSLDGTARSEPVRPCADQFSWPLPRQTTNNCASRKTLRMYPDAVRSGASRCADVGLSAAFPGAVTCPGTMKRGSDECPIRRQGT